MKQSITVCAFIYNNKKELFVGKRSSSANFLPNVYELVGGHVEFGEDLETALKREIKEEAGINLIVENPFFAFTYINSKKDKQTVEIIYFAKIANPLEKISLNSEELSEHVWISESEVDKYLKDNPKEKEAAEIGFKLLNNKF